VAWAIVLAGVFWFPYDFSFERSEIRSGLGQFLSTPFHAYFYSTELRAATEALRKALVFLPMGGALAWAFRPPQFDSVKGLVLIASAAFCAAVAGTIEIGQIALPSHTADMGDAIFETLGGLAGYVAVRAIALRRRPADRPSFLRRHQ
jgi:glycopeptide antibiotics resistance protein